MRSGTVENLHDFKGKLDKIKELKIFKKIYAVTLDKCEEDFKRKKALTYIRIVFIMNRYIVKTQMRSSRRKRCLSESCRQV